MAKLIDLSKLSPEELQEHHTRPVEELARRHVDAAAKPLTMSEMELAAVRMTSGGSPPAIAAMLSRMKPEKPTAKACPQLLLSEVVDGDLGRDERAGCREEMLQGVGSPSASWILACHAA